MSGPSRHLRTPSSAPQVANLEKCNPELFTLTYGAIVRQLLNDFEDNVEEVNKQLDKMCVPRVCRGEAEAPLVSLRRRK